MIQRVWSAGVLALLAVMVYLQLAILSGVNATVDTLEGFRETPSPALTPVPTATPVNWTRSYALSIRTAEVEDGPRACATLETLEVGQATLTMRDETGEIVIQELFSRSGDWWIIPCQELPAPGTYTVYLVNMLPGEAGSYGPSPMVFEAGREYTLGFLDRSVRA